MGECIGLNNMASLPDFNYLIFDNLNRSEDFSGTVSIWIIENVSKKTYFHILLWGPILSVQTSANGSESKSLWEKKKLQCPSAFPTDSLTISAVTWGVRPCLQRVQVNCSCQRLRLLSSVLGTRKQRPSAKTALRQRAKENSILE